jgi:hypothetical protein
MNGCIARHRGAVHGTFAALSLCACAAVTVTPGAPKVVKGHPLPPYQFHEECMRLAPGDRVDYTFESTEPVAFNIHYREGKVVLIPVSRERTRSDAGIFAAPLAQHYCLTWETGAAGALIDYRIRVLPANV